MALGDKDYSIPLPLPELWLAKSDRTIVAKINNKSGLGFSRFGKRTKFIKHNQLDKLNSVDELEFSIPYQIEVNHKLVRNPVVDQINESSLIKRIFNGEEKWFTVVDIKKTMDDSKDILDLSCRSLNYELMRRYVRNFKVVSANLSSLCLGGTTINSNGDTVSLSGLLQGTLWTLSGDTDLTFDTIYRSIDISKATVLDALIQISKTFNAIMIFDTINRKIKFMQLLNVGLDIGGRITYENYMKSLENESKTDLLITRFVPYGKNGLTINAINGTNHIDDFSFFTAGFSRDVNKNVLTSSHHMSDSLAGAILDYAQLQSQHNGEFTSLLDTLSSYQSQLTTKQNDMATLNTALVAIQKQLDIAQTTGQSTTSLLSQQTSQKALIASKQSEIDTVNANIVTTNNSITSLQTLLSTNSNFTQAQQTELIPFIREVDWTDSNISSAKELYNQALIQFQKYKTPQITLKVDMVNIWEDIESQFVWDKFRVGNDILVEYDVLGTSVKSKVIELSFDHAAGNVQIVVASVVDIIRQQEQVFNMLYQSVSAANTLSVNVDNWNSIDSVAKSVNAIYNNGIDAAKIALSGAANNSVKFDNRGITITDSADSNKFLRATNGVIGLTKDGGNTFSTAISANGIYAPLLVGQILIGSELNLTNQTGTVSVDGNGMTVSSMDLSVVKSDTKSRVLISGANGLKIQKNTGSVGSPVWGDVFNADSSGDLSITGNINATSGNFSGNITATGTITGGTISGANFNNGAIVGSSISVNGNFTVNSSGFATMTGANVSGTINATSGSLGSLTVTGTLTGGYISGTNITGSTISTRVNGSSGIVINSGFADTTWYSGSNTLFKVYDALDHVELFSGLSNGVKCTGTWNFSSATVYGLTAKFA